MMVVRRCCSTASPASQSYVSRLKRNALLYGPVGVACHTVLSLTSLASWYGVAAYGVDIASLMDRFGYAGAVSTGSAFALAYVAHKVTMPVRVPVTLMVTPYVARALKRGLPRPPL
ncbi:unnamed protein product (mitochondrion) [Plasmodiophora brassicae]|uniref:DUF1279 domain-containing protein n=1 Tax=Plasmodiophora brassicae TaxID=37360 RepID=A0A0G4INT1_PLABS|nr:hypothetical protein PBRA_005582 [Plasmodiophora brassicae]SPR01931.1 unnamed protein product [Plasmodiophora brassicae]